MLLYSYMIEEGVCFLVLCEHNHDKASAFAYLDDLYREFRVGLLAL